MAVTDEDRAKVQRVALALADVLDDHSGMWPLGVEIIAAALAAEREKARAPFLALAQELAKPPTIAEYGEVRHAIAARIRTAAQGEP